MASPSTEKAKVDTEATTLLEAPLDSEAATGWISWRLLGPGLLVCLADTDAGCLLVAAQSGARWGYSLLLLQIVLIPILFVAQELTVRLAVYTRQGHTACIKQHFGPFWAWACCCLLVVECAGAMTSEMSGIAAVAELHGFDRTSGTLLATLTVCGVVLSFDYKTVEFIGVTLGLCELTFVATMSMLKPSPGEVITGAFTFYSDPEYIQLWAANIGAVIMPWMIYFQQNAVVARKLNRSEDLAEERGQTLFGSFLTQLVMIGMLVTLATDKSRPSNLEGVKDIVDALVPVLGGTAAKALVSIGFVGGSLCAAFVVSLASSWAVCEAADLDDSFAVDRGPRKSPAFYALFVCIVLVGAIVLLSGVDVVRLNVFVEYMDGILMPFTIGFLFLLAGSDILPPEARLQGCYKYLLGTLFTAVSAVSLGTAFYSFVQQ